MRYLGICENTRFIYGGDMGNGVRLSPATQLFPISIVDAEIGLLPRNFSEYGDHLFFETYYDPVTMESNQQCIFRLVRSLRDAKSGISVWSYSRIG